MEEQSFDPVDHDPKEYSANKPIREWKIEDIAQFSFKSVDEAENFYNQYAFEVGFSIRKDKLKIEGETIKMRSFLCSKAGFRRSKGTEPIEGSTSKQRPRYETRCGCGASFKVRLSKDDMLYHPVEFNPIHNHDLVSMTLSHLLPSHRNVDDASAHHISELRAAGIKPSQIMQVIVQNRGGYENVGFTCKDLFNHIYNNASGSEVTHECELALQYLQGLARVDPGVYVRVDTDTENTITKIFLSDTISRSDYSLFGDVVVCDSTYKTNHLRLPLALLVGVDNHCASIVYACALLTEETKEAYQWVFETFIACMGRAPGLIITDGDKAMQWAIREVMPTTRHRLCYWHIVRRLVGPCQNPLFKRDLEIVMRKRFPRAVFWQKWNEMLEKYGILERNPRWAEDMTSTVELWAESFFEGVFTAGLFSNQRAESINSKLKKNVDASLTVYKFYQKYFVFIDCLRQRAMRNECINSQSKPANLEKLAFKSIRKQIAKTYTLAVYEKLDKDIINSDEFSCHIVNLVQDSPYYRVRADKYDPQETRCKHFLLSYDKRDDSIVCNCGKFESHGLPCLHMFACMKQLGVTRIANRNLTRRWFKEARSFCSLSSSCSQSLPGNGSRLAIVRPQCERLAQLASLGDEHIAMAMREIGELSKRLGKLTVQEEVGGFNLGDISSISDIRPMFGDPPIVRTKGAPSRRAASTPRHCSYCLQPGHSKPTCERRKLDEGVNDDGGKKKRVV